MRINRSGMLTSSHIKSPVNDLNLPFMEAKNIDMTISQNEKYDHKMMTEMNESF